MRRLGRAAANRMNIHRLSITAAGHASGRVPAEAEARPVVGNSAYRKSTPDGQPRARRRRRRRRIKPGRRRRDGPIIARPPSPRRQELGRGRGSRSRGHVRPSVGRSVTVAATSSSSSSSLLYAPLPVAASYPRPPARSPEVEPRRFPPSPTPHRNNLARGASKIGSISKTDGNLSLSVGGGGVARAISGGNRTARRLSLSLARARRAG